MFSTSPQALMAYGIAFGIAVLVGLVAWWLYTTLKAAAIDADYDNQLRELISGDSDEDELMNLDRGRNFSEKWRLYWQRVGAGSGFSRYSNKNNNLYKEVIVIWIIVTVIVSVVMRNPILGALVGSAVLYSFTLISKKRYNNQQGKIQDQIPGFLFALKANIQANETPLRAVLKVVDNMPEPLHSDLMVVKQKILANSSFADALRALVEKTTSSELRFLATCLIQAAGTGANIEPQLDTIQRVLEQRRKAQDELQKAIKGTIPAIFVSSVAIPGSFLATYMMDPNAQQFWFKTLLSWAALAVILALYGFGMWMTHRMVEAIRHL